MFHFMCLLLWRSSLVRDKNLTPLKCIHRVEIAVSTQWFIFSTHFHHCVENSKCTFSQRRSRIFSGILIVGTYSGVLDRHASLNFPPPSPGRCALRVTKNEIGDRLWEKVHLAFSTQWRKCVEKINHCVATAISTWWIYPNGTSPLQC